MTIGEDDPITLVEACEIAFRNRIRPATLRAEAARGRLTIFRIGRRDFTTLKSVRDLQCRAENQARASTSIHNEDSGLSETARISSARAALSQTIARLKNSSPDTSAKSTHRNGGRPR